MIKLNEEMQQLIIRELGIIAAIALIGTIILSIILPENMAIIALIFGVVTTIVGALSAFLNTKNMSEKEAEVLEQNIHEQYEGGDDVQ